MADQAEGKNFWIRANRRSGSYVDLSGDGVHWLRHPDEGVDVAVHPWAFSEELDLGVIPKKMFVTAIGSSDDVVGIGDEVLITGLFSPAMGTQRNMPIVRSGNVAMLPDEPIPTAMGPMDAYLIEGRSIGGLSGSPVFVRETLTMKVPAPNSRATADTPYYSLSGGKLYLLGLMHGHWDIDRHHMNSPEPHVTQKGESGGINIGIGIVVPAAKIVETIEQPSLAGQRQEFEAQLVAQRGPPTADGADG